MEPFVMNGLYRKRSGFDRVLWLTEGVGWWIVDGTCALVLLLSVERDQERGKGAGLYNSFKRVNPASENEEEDLMKAFLASEVDMVSDVHFEGSMNVVLMERGCVQGAWDIVHSWGSLFGGDVDTDVDVHVLVYVGVIYRLYDSLFEVSKQARPK